MSRVAPEICKEVVVPDIVDASPKVICCRKEGGSILVELLAGGKATLVSLFARVPDDLAEGKRKAHEGRNQSGDDGDCHVRSRRAVDVLVKQKSLTGPRWAM